MIFVAREHMAAKVSLCSLFGVLRYTEYAGHHDAFRNRRSLAPPWRISSRRSAIMSAIASVSSSRSVVMLPTIGSNPPTWLRLKRMTNSAASMRSPSRSRERTPEEPTNAHVANPAGGAPSF